MAKTKYKNGEPFAIYNRHGVVVFLSLCEDLDDAWRLFTGWGTKEDIAKLKEDGYWATSVDILEQHFGK